VRDYARLARTLIEKHARPAAIRVIDAALEAFPEDETLQEWRETMGRLPEQLDEGALEELRKHGYVGDDRPSRLTPRPGANR